MQRERYQATRAVGSGATLLLCLLLAWLPQAASADLLLPVPDRRDHVFDPLGRWLYVTTESGAVERFELPGGRRLPAFGLGGPLNALDVTPDGTALYVAEHYRTGGQGAFARIDVATGRVTRISFDPGSHEYGAWDVAITSTGLGMTTTRGSGKLRELDTATGSLSIVPLSTFGYEPIRGEASIGRGADRTLLVFSDARPVFTYDAEADRFSPQIHSVARWNSASGVDRNATLIGVEVETGVKLFTASRLAVGEIPGILGGFVFDSVADVLYGVEPQHDELVLFDTDGLGEIGRMPIGENVGASQTFGDGVMSISDTGQWIALSTPSGIRVFELPDRAPPGDPDGDGWSGTDDSCPLDPNPLQDDPDGDGWGSPCDNCPALSNPEQPDLDRDGLGDACDPFPGLALTIVPSPAWSVALAGDSVRVRYRLETRDGSPLPDLPGVRATLTVNGSARFGSTATQGILLEGGGTARVKVEFVAGAFEIDVSDPMGETVRLGAEDTDRIGIEMLAPIETFEVDDGGFSAPGLLWEHGVPASGPERAFSGTRVWATGLAAAPAEGVSESLVSPAIGLPVDSTPWLEYVSWLSTRFSDAVVEVSSDAGASWTALETRSGFHPEYTRRSFDLSAWSGQTVRIRFRYESEDHSLYSGWYLDDVAIRGVGTMLDFLDPAGDLDDDGLTNQEELSLGTDPYDPDFDGDGIDDGSDNCPLAANAEQSDAVHPGGAGDACDDPEGDGISDDRDNCPDAANPEQENTDG
ncbi:MAG: thrombospondin type 3 repeat-containing protein, partial [Myxococcota bacterium]|nr:thrombospondin type 3 repeat-containing protein [Myxococcota bacterium]